MPSNAELLTQLLVHRRNVFTGTQLPAPSALILTTLQLFAEANVTPHVMEHDSLDLLWGAEATDSYGSSFRVTIACLRDGRVRVESYNRRKNGYSATRWYRQGEAGVDHNRVEFSWARYTGQAHLPVYNSLMYPHRIKDHLITRLNRIAELTS